MDRPITTLFMLMSVDGKISTGATDFWSLNSGRVQEKIGINMKELPNKSPVSCDTGNIYVLSKESGEEITKKPLIYSIVILIPIIMMILMVCGCLYIYERFTKEDEKINKYMDIYTDRNAGNDTAPVTSLENTAPAVCSLFLFNIFNEVYE